MAFLFDGETINGTSDDDFIFGILGGPDHTLNGGAGNDIIIGDHHGIAVGSNGLGNNSIANAFNLDDIGNWYTGIFRIVEASALEYTTVYAEGEGDVEVFSVTVGAEESFLIDIDFANFDALVEILDGSGTVLASNNDASFLDQGSLSLSDSRINTSFETAGTYYIRVSEVDDGSGETNIEAGEHFFMHVTVNNHASSGVQVFGDDIINGDEGDDTIWGLEGDDTINGGDGNDVINAGEGIDTVDGGAGDDLFIDNFGSGPGDLDFYDGGDGIDTLDISGSGTIGSEFNLLTGQQTYSGTVRDTFANIENITVANSSTLIGNDVANVFIARGNAVNIISGNGGDDIIDAGRLGDTVDGGDGFDFISFESSLFNNVVVNLGNTAVNTNDAAGDTYTSIEGVIGTTLSDTITGDANDNTIIGGRGNDVLDGGDGIDTTSYASASSGVNIDLNDLGQQDTLGAGQDTLSNFENIIGSDFDDNLIGDDQDNAISAGAGADMIDGGGGSDTLSGGDGDDVLIGDTQNDILNGDGGDDTLIGGLGVDFLYGGDGNDLLLGGNRNDTLDGGAGNDRTFGGNGDDDVMGGAGDDILRGGDQNDVLTAGDGNDFLFGGTGIDTLSGGAGNDTLIGRGGFDFLNGGEGDDILEGGSNADDFIFVGAFGNDIITDFDANNDAEDIDLSGVTEITDITDLLNNHANQIGADVVIDDGLGNTITLQNVDLADLDAADFIF